MKKQQQTKGGNKKKLLLLVRRTASGGGEKEMIGSVITRSVGNFWLFFNKLTIEVKCHLFSLKENYKQTNKQTKKKERTHSKFYGFLKMI